MSVVICKEKYVQQDLRHCIFIIDRLGVYLNILEY